MTILLKPNAGVQYDFASCEADCAFYGGPAGCGKTALLQMESCRFYNNPLYTGIIFRRESTSITRPGGMWDTGLPIYTALGARPTEQKLKIRFKAGGKLQYSHLENEKTKFLHHGGQYAFIGFDEIQEFTFTQFTYLITRSRAVPPCPIKGYVRLTGNATFQSWVRPFIDWWIPPPPAPGIPYPERCGVLRYFVIKDEQIHWVDKDYRDEFGNPPISFTFFGAKLDDNPVDKGWRDDYRRKIAAMDRVTRLRLGVGDWNVVESGGIFKREWFKFIDKLPDGIKLWRYWDKAATEKKEDNSPAHTAGGLVGMYNGELYIGDINDFAKSPAQSEDEMRKTAENDGHDVTIAWEQEKAGDGKYTSSHLQRNVFRGFECHPDKVSKDKVERARPWAALAEHGHVYIVRGSWNAQFLNQVVNFNPEYTGLKDMVDCISGGYKMIFQTKRIFPDYSEGGKETEFDIDFQNTPKQNALITCYIEQDQGQIAIIFTFWGRQSQKLFVYNELVQYGLSTEQIISGIAEKLNVPIRNSQKLSLGKLLIGSDLAKGGDDVRRIIRKKMNFWARENKNYDLNGGIITLRSLNQNNQLFVHKNCVETNRQIKEWTYADNTQGKPQAGFPLCRALCGVVGDLKAIKEIEPPRPPEPYSREAAKKRNILLNQIKGVTHV